MIFHERISYYFHEGIACYFLRKFLFNKKKPKKSNNENEGDVWTILQESDESGTIKILNISMMYLYTEFPDIGINRIL